MTVNKVRMENRTGTGVMRLAMFYGAFLYGLAAAGASGNENPAPIQPVMNVCTTGEPVPVSLNDVVISALDAQPQLLISKEAVVKARANLIAARSPFLPNVTLSFQSERFFPNQIIQPVTIGNTVVGGSLATKTSYGSIGLSWNLYNGGKDAAAFHATRADLRANEEGFTHQLDETIMAVLNAYAEVYSAQRDAQAQEVVLKLQQAIEKISEQRYRQGRATTLAVAQAQIDVLETSKSYYQACRTLADKSATLAQIAGVHLKPDELYRVEDTLPEPLDRTMTDTDWKTIVDNDPAVVSAKQEMMAEEYKVKQAKSAYGPSLVLEGRKDYLGQDVESWRAANHITPNSYRIGLQIQQPLLPFTSEYAGVKSARSDFRKAQASYEQALLETESKYHAAMSAMHAADEECNDARKNLENARDLLALTRQQYAAGRTEEDKVEQAETVVEKASSALDETTSEQRLSHWLMVKVSEPRLFPERLTRQLNVSSEGMVLK